MKKSVLAFALITICLLSSVVLSSCSEDKEIEVTTTQEQITEKTYKTSGVFNDTVNWRYDEAESVFSFEGIGIVEKNGEFDYEDIFEWSRIVTCIRFEEGITDADEYDLSSFYNVKTVYLSSTYQGYIPDFKNIEKFIVAENNPCYSSDENGVLFNSDMTELILYPRCNPSETYAIPDGVKIIRERAFDGSENLKTVVMPETIEKISKIEFKKSSVYSNPENWTDNVFYAGNILMDCNYDKVGGEIAVRDGTVRIAGGAFAHCRNIKSITVPDSVRAIGDKAFIGCSSLERVYIGSGVELIGDRLFNDEIEWSPCSNLESIEVSKDNKFFSSEDGVLFDKDKNKLFQYPTGKRQNKYIVPDSVTYIADGAFCHCSELKKLIIGKGITEIDYPMIFHSEKIETVVLPDTITKLDRGAFKWSGIKYIDIPDSVTYIGSEVMSGCSRLETVNIGKGVSYIDDAAIGSGSLKEINVDPENEFYSSEDGILFNKDKSEILLYPENKVGETYRLPESVKTIKRRAFTGSNNLKEIYIGAGVEKIEGANFYSYIENPETGPEYVSNYKINYDGTLEQWNSLITDEYAEKYIDKSKVKCLK